MNCRCNQPVDFAATHAIALARRRGALEVTADDLLGGCLLAVARFGIVDLGSVVVDLDELGLLWRDDPAGSPAGLHRVSYSDQAVALFDQAARIARAALPARSSLPTPPVRIADLMAAVAFDQRGLCGELQMRFGVTSKLWRAGLARQTPLEEDASPVPVDVAVRPPDREYLSPEDAAQTLGVHVQTLRAYIRSGKLPALRLAGERAIRIRREDLAKVLEPLQAET